MYKMVTAGYMTVVAVRIQTYLHYKNPNALSGHLGVLRIEAVSLVQSLCVPPVFSSLQMPGVSGRSETDEVRL